MTSRIGTCSGCGAKFKIPDAFTGTRGKCKKCGGVVEIPAIEEQEAEAVMPEAPAPAAKGPAAAAAAAPVRRAGAAAGRRSARGRSRAPRGKAPAGRTASRRRGGDEESEGVQSWVWIVVAASVVGIAVVLFIILSGNGAQEPATTDLASATDTASDLVEPEPEAPVEETVPEEVTVDEPFEPEPSAEDTTAAPAVSPEEQENVDPVIKLDPLPPIIGCDQEEFDRLTECFTDGFVKEELPRFKRAPLLEEFEAAEWRLKVPILLNSFNGLDLLKPNDVALAFRIAEMWNKLTGGGFVDVPVKGDTTDEEMEANLYYNVKNIYAIYEIWKNKIDDVDAQQDFFDKCEKYREKAAAKEGEG